MSVSVFLLSFFYIKIPVFRFKYNFISPLVLLPAFVVLYMIVGFQAYWKGRYEFLNVDFSPYLNRLYDVTSIFEVCFFLFFVFFYYYFKKDEERHIHYDYKLNSYYFLSFVTFISVYAVFAIAGMKLPVLHNFIMLFFNSAIIVISYAYITKVRGSLLLLFLFSLLVVYMGFRYRLIYLFLPIVFSFFILYKLSFYRFLKYFLITFCAVFLIALVGVTRKYSEGLQWEKIEGMSFFDILVKGFFNDTSTVLTSGAIIEWLDKTENFAYLKQVWYVFNYFIPNELYPEKEYSPIFSYVSILTGQANNESGAAVLGFAEYYHTAGYYGVLVFAFIFALILSKFFRRMVVSNSKYEHFYYFVLLTWFINSLTRGYFSQNAQDLISILIGLYIIRRLSKSIDFGVSG